MGTYRRMVSAFIVLTEFARIKFIEGGLPRERLFVKPNFLMKDPGPGTGQGDFALFIGRLVPEKGISTLLNAWRQLKGVKLKIAGDGPLSAMVSAEAAQNPDVEWLGHIHPDQATQLMGDARVLVFPSEWYEGLPFVIVEALARGTPVVAPELGAMPSLVVPGLSGLLFKPGSAGALAARVGDLWSYPLPGTLRRSARLEFEANYTPEQHYRRIITIYSQALDPGEISQASRASRAVAD
jgi:glycosyltransferase involved in cell wall biosynthesis